jgi:hypothetical protein
MRRDGAGTRGQQRTVPHSGQANGRGDGISVRGAVAGLWLVLASVGRVVLLHHAGGDAAALADRQAVLVRPGPDITRALAASRSPPGAGEAARPARRACSR